MDFREFVLRVRVNASLDRVWAAWATAAVLEQWFLTNADYLDANGTKLAKTAETAEGGRYWWRWAEGTVEEGEVLRCEPHRALEFTFGEGVLVLVELEPESDAATMVKLTQTHLVNSPEKRQQIYVSCTQGWTFYMANLKSHLEGGLDLREKSPEGLKDWVNV